MDLAAIRAASNDTRIEHIKRDRWITTAQAEEAEWHIRHAFLQPEVIRPLGVLVWGPSNSGKSALLERCLRSFSQPLDAPAGDKPRVLLVPAPDEAEKPQLLEALLSAMDPFFIWSGRRQGNLRSLERDALGCLRDLQPNALIFDDISNLAVARGRGQAASLNLLRRLSRHLSLICAGTHAVHSVLAADQQLKERLAFVKLGPFEAQDEFRRFVRKYERSFPLRNETDWTDHMFDQVFQATDGLVGRVVVLLKQAAILAVEEGEEALTPKLLSAPRANRALASTQKRQEAKRRGRAIG